MSNNLPCYCSLNNISTHVRQETPRGALNDILMTVTMIYIEADAKDVYQSIVIISIDMHAAPD